MPRWRALPDELDPQVREFAIQLRRLVDRDGLSLAALADRTGYSKTSWERYLNGRLLAPKGAVVALAEVTGGNPVHLTTMWELAERAWSRSEMRHDSTMEAIRVSRAGAVRDISGDSPPPGSGAVGSGGGGGRRRLGMALAAAVGVLVALAVVFFLTDDRPGDTDRKAGASPSPSISASTTPPPDGVRCRGASCAGEDAEAMRCAGDLVTTVRSVTVGRVLVEVRYSRTCGVAWGRIRGASLGDVVTATVGKAEESGSITESGDTLAYTPMMVVTDPDEATVCVVPAVGARGCTGESDRVGSTGGGPVGGDGDRVAEGAG